MKRIRSNSNIYTILLITIVLSSLVQLNLLGTGLRTILSTEQESISTPKLQIKPTAVPSVHGEHPIFKPERIVIEKVGISLPVVSVPLENGTWQVNPHVANYAEGTSMIDQKGGNVGIFGHDRLDAFAKIKSLLTSYDIIVYGNDYKAIYKVESASVIAPDAVNVFYPTKEPMLTLITCNGLFSEKRYMVKAKLNKIEKIK